MAQIAVVGGAGYVGLAYAALFANLGHQVAGLDIDATKVAQLNDGGIPIHEPGLAESLQGALAAGNLTFVTDYAKAIPDASFIFICVGTPAAATGHADTGAVMAATQAIARHATGSTVVVTKSTLPVGTVHRLGRVLTEQAADDTSFSVVANPEFLREGSALHDVFHPDRIVIGSDDPAAAEQVAALYAPLGASVLITDPCSAEMVKYASNAFLASKISFINEVALVCERLHADVEVVARGMGLDRRIGPEFLNAGIGFGGSCFPKDVRALAAMARDMGMEPTMLDAVLTINQRARGQVIEKLVQHLDRLAGRTIAMLGFAFKPDTDDIRDAPALAIARQLLASGARIRGTDPAAMAKVATVLPEIELSSDPYAAATGADAVLILTEWPVYRSLDLDHLANAMRGRLLIDGRNVVAPEAAMAVGLIYEGVGRGSVSAPVMPERRSNIRQLASA